MFGYSIDKILHLTNAAYIISLAITLVLSIVLWRLSALSGRLKEERLAQYQADAEIKISSAQNQSEQAKAEAAKANENAALANERAALLAKQAEEARLEQEKLKAQLAWRTLTPVMFKKLHDGFSKGSGSITIAYINSDPESLFLAIQISKAFENTNWQVRSESRTYATRLLWGITIPAHEGKEMDILRNAFRDAGIPFSTTDVPAPDMAFKGPGESEALIMIGSKPPPF